MLEYSHVHVAQSDLTTAARYMFWLKSVSNLSWSYAAFLSAVRARSLIG